MPHAAFEFSGISKSFFGVNVLREVSFAVSPGRTLGLVGENGAGKSTLMNVLGGNLRPDAGRLLLDGLTFDPRSPLEAERRGVAFIHQELNLFSNLTVAENVFLNGFPRRKRFLPFVDKALMRERTRELMREVGLERSPDALVEQLSAGERQLVEVAKALNRRARIILFDEPTTSLSSRETESLFRIMRRLQSSGQAMIYISHNLEHVRQLCHDLVVLRDGQVVGCGEIGDFSLDRIVSLMVGRQIEQYFPRRRSKPREENLFEVEHLTQPGIVRDVNLRVRRGEVLGLSGLMGSGRSELARILFGLDPCREGVIRLGGVSLRELTPRQRLQRGLAFVTEDRREEGLCLEASIADNLALVALPRHVRTWAHLVSASQIAHAVARVRKEVRLPAGVPSQQAVQTLSGGNQQKVVLGKWLLHEPDMFILDEPTRGIDVGAKAEIYHLINDLAARGKGILMISSEMEELIGMCDRILVLNRGEIRDAVESSEFDRERLLKAALQGEQRS